MTVPARAEVALLLAHQAGRGAFPASPNFSQYPFAWLRDGTFIAHALDRVGEHEAAGRFFGWAARTVGDLRPRIDDLVRWRRNGEPIPEDAFLPTRFALDGAPLNDHWPNFQLDGYGQWLWGLGEHLARVGSPDLPDGCAAGVDATLAYLDAFWNEPCYDCWEEFPYRWHTATLASIYAGAQAMARFRPRAAELAERVRNFVLEHCVQDGRLVKFVGLAVPDASLLWTAVPFGLLGVRDPVYQATVAAIERELVVEGGVHRYGFDTYYGGGGWLLLTAWLGWVYVRQGEVARAEEKLAWVRAHMDTQGGLPEQVDRHLLHPLYRPYWRDRWGAPAHPLLWSHAMALILESELHEARAHRDHASALRDRRPLQAPANRTLPA